ncbi:DUF7544 domain-containing protein [Halegenticoccus tardaugens]|uniref:DUF7544 domain-containing protein n=1 Tax=Halegenticoccus tardaugens TaxID=2071624 RepID=UPI00100BB5FB|nr:hypothetical protein [Halegenticoccus tardaugens]
MSSFALDALDDAREATASLLLPVDRRRWLRLALLAFFLGGGTAVGGNVNLSTQLQPLSDASLPRLVTADVAPGAAVVEAVVASGGAVVALLVAAGGLAAAAALYVLLGSIMEFVLVEGVRSRSIRVREPFRAHAGDGLRLFAFRVALAAVALAGFAVPLGAAFLADVAVTSALALLAIPALLLAGAVALVAALADRLTVDFVVPAMVAEDRGVVSAWRRFAPALRASWKGFALYLLVRYALFVGAGVAVWFVLLLSGLLVALPFVPVAVGLNAALAAGALGFAGWAALGLLAALYALAVAVVALFVQAPVVTYFRYYSLFALGRADPTLDLVSHLRGDGS